MENTAEDLLTRVHRPVAKDRESYILSCALDSAKKRYLDAVTMDNLYRSKTTAQSVGLHRGLIFFLLEQP